MLLPTLVTTPTSGSPVQTQRSRPSLIQRRAAISTLRFASNTKSRLPYLLPKNPKPKKVATYTCTSASPSTQTKQKSTYEPHPQAVMTRSPLTSRTNVNSALRYSNGGLLKPYPAPPGVLENHGRTARSTAGAPLCTSENAPLSRATSLETRRSNNSKAIEKRRTIHPRRGLGPLQSGNHQEDIGMLYTNRSQAERKPCSRPGQLAGNNVSDFTGLAKHDKGTSYDIKTAKNLSSKPVFEATRVPDTVSPLTSKSRPNSQAIAPRIPDMPDRHRRSAILPRPVPVKPVSAVRNRNTGLRPKPMLEALTLDNNRFASLPTQIIAHSPIRSEVPPLPSMPYKMLEATHHLTTVWTMTDEMHLIRNGGVISPSRALMPHPDVRVTPLFTRRYNGVPDDYAQTSVRALRKSITVPIHLEPHLQASALLHLHGGRVLCRQQEQKKSQASSKLNRGVRTSTGGLSHSRSNLFLTSAQRFIKYIKAHNVSSNPFSRKA